MHFLQSYGPEHLLTFSNLRRAGLLTEQAPGETLTAVESKVSKLVTDKAAGEQGAQVTSSPHPSPTGRAPWERENGKENVIPFYDCITTISASRKHFHLLNIPRAKVFRYRFSFNLHKG